MEMEENNICAIFESVLFSAGEAVSEKRLSQIIGITQSQIAKVADMVIKKFNSKNSGIKVIKVGDKYQMCSKNEYAYYIRKFMNIRKDSSLTSAATEVLAIIAYKQPVTRGFIENIRGVDCREIINSLTRKNLIEEKDRLSIPGNPITYGTTDKFLRCIGLESIHNLPAPLPTNSGDKA